MSLHSLSLPAAQVTIMVATVGTKDSKSYMPFALLGFCLYFCSDCELDIFNKSSRTKSVLVEYQKCPSVANGPKRAEFGNWCILFPQIQGRHIEHCEASHSCDEGNSNKHILWVHINKGTYQPHPTTLSHIGSYCCSSVFSVFGACFTTWPSCAILNPFMITSGLTPWCCRPPEKMFDKARQVGRCRRKRETTGDPLKA